MAGKRRGAILLVAFYLTSTFTAVVLCRGYKGSAVAGAPKGRRATVGEVGAGVFNCPSDG